MIIIMIIIIFRKSIRIPIPIAIPIIVRSLKLLLTYTILSLSSVDSRRLFPACHHACTAHAYLIYLATYTWST